MGILNCIYNYRKKLVAHKLHIDKLIEVLQSSTNFKITKNTDTSIGIDYTGYNKFDMLNAVYTALKNCVEDKNLDTGSLSIELFHNTRDIREGYTVFELY